MFREYFLALLINPYNLSSSLLATAILRALSIISGLNVLRLLTNISKASSNIGLVSSLWVLTFFRRTWNGRTARESLGYFLFLFDFIFPLPKSASRLWGPQLCLWNVFGWNIWQGFQGKDQFLSYTAMTRFVWVWHDLIIISWNHCLSRTLLKVNKLTFWRNTPLRLVLRVSMWIFSPAKTVLRTCVMDARVSPQNNSTNLLNTTPCRKIILEKKVNKYEIRF